ncbi:MAG: 2-amino-4-hydroxy-6-hydroxymethyldihydropteridine diphosphokinase [Bradyrhizobiaceae bacterium]|nr:2-amino-4-hydroxy-6-hydroxymethyldihydropteridine diphosphokinase [Bradyrhizobiaceae bacterium]
MIEALVALGSNEGNSRETLNCAIALFCDGRDVRLVRRSSDYRTPPWGVSDQPDFINACLLIATALSPHILLARAQRIEQELGRDRSQERRWGPRPIDIDLLAYDDVAVDEPGLKLPHPRLFERAFVLVPLVEIAPDWVIAGINVRDALTRVDRSGIKRLS